MKNQQQVPMAVEYTQAVKKLPRPPEVINQITTATAAQTAWLRRPRRAKPCHALAAAGLAGPAGASGESDMGLPEAGIFDSRMLRAGVGR